MFFKLISKIWQLGLMVTLFLYKDPGRFVVMSKFQFLWVMMFLLVEDSYFKSSYFEAGVR